MLRCLLCCRRLLYSLNGLDRYSRRGRGRQRGTRRVCRALRGRFRQRSGAQGSTARGRARSYRGAARSGA